LTSLAGGTMAWGSATRSSLWSSPFKCPGTLYRFQEPLATQYIKVARQCGSSQNLTPKSWRILSVESSGTDVISQFGDGKWQAQKTRLNRILQDFGVKFWLEATLSGKPWLYCVARFLEANRGSVGIKRWWHRLDLVADPHAHSSPRQRSQPLSLSLINHIVPYGMGESW